MQNNMIEANKLRNKIELNKLPKDRPGYYKWWGDRKVLDIILNKLKIEYEDVCSCLEKKEDLFCIYVGVAIKESVKARLDWHINQINTESAVKNGTLSTLRQTISSIVCEDMRNTEQTNLFIDKLLVEYYFSMHPIKSEEARNEIHNIEQKYLNSDKLYLLNIQDNKHPLSPRKKLTELRKKSK